MRLIALILMLLLAGLRAWAEPPAAGPVDVALDHAGQVLQHWYFGRAAQLGPCDLELPILFDDPSQPVIQVDIAGRNYPLLFDTGTWSCIFWADTPYGLPPVLIPTSDSAALAALEGKQLNTSSGVALEYALVPAMRLGGIRLRNAALRVYTGAAAGDAGYCGAFSPMLLRSFVIEVDNGAGEIRLRRHTDWTPRPGARLLPVLTLPRGLFVPLVIDGEQYWFHFDTGFGGTLGLQPAVVAAHAGAITRLAGESEDYQGWREQYSYERISIAAVTLPSYPLLKWSESAPLKLSGVEALAWRESYSELASYHIGGIAGSGFWQRFDYALDIELGRLYLWERETDIGK